MTDLICPACGLAIQVRAAYLAPRNCPRCIARRQVAVPMYETAQRARLAGDRASVGAPLTAAPFQLRRASPLSGTDTAA
ncbi:MAG TPA: hypothetical protein VJT75_02545 [Thermoleophilaceae bacterium]|nr:hypothetical protein [Thermoleophilaceae bacterium]